MKNQQVAEAFVRGSEDAKTKNLFIEGNVLYSYGYHFPLCVRLFGGFIINKDGYSVSTSRHKGYIKRELSDFIEMTTQQLKEIINAEVKTIEEAKNLFILRAL